MVKRKKNEPADKAAERLKQMLDARRAVPDEEQPKEEPTEKEPKENPAEPEKGAQAPDKQKDC